MSELIQKYRGLMTLFVGLLVLTMSMTLIFVDKSSLMANITGSTQHEPFDGTVYPIANVPNWVKISASNWDLNYAELDSTELIDLPYYDPNQLAIDTDTLEWGDEKDDKIRNAKITYSVPYMGNYLLDGQEDAGSHLAVDIKTPEGTPVFAMANGSVIKVSNVDSGFGYHIVLKHENVPSLEDPDAKTVLYSSYSHLGSILVTEGEAVKKGEQIALSGSTGTATTPHLHFQIDNENAPWHPFWPFTFQEAVDAGLDFFTAINAGLGAELAKETTVNPMKYIQKYMTDTPVVVSEVQEDPVVDLSNEENDESPAINEETEIDLSETIASNIDSTDIVEVNEDNTESEVARDPQFLEFVIEVMPEYSIEDDTSYKILLRDQFGETYDGGFSGTVSVKSANEYVSPVNPDVSVSDFEDGVYADELSDLRLGRDRLYLEYDGETFYSDWFNVVGTGEKSDFIDVKPGDEYYEAISYLAGRNVIAGYPDKSFRPDRLVSRVESLKFILEGIDAELSKGSLPFGDVSANEWYYSYLFTAYNLGIVNGYDDNTFKPASVVNKAEFFRILFNSLNEDLKTELSSDPFFDVLASDWYAPYAARAKELEIIDGSSSYFNPAKEMTRGEVADAMYRLMKL